MRGMGRHLYGLGLMTVSWEEREGSLPKRSTTKAESGLRSLGATLPMRWDSRMRRTCKVLRYCNEDGRVGMLHCAKVCGSTCSWRCTAYMFQYWSMLLPAATNRHKNEMREEAYESARAFKSARAWAARHLTCQHYALHASGMILDEFSHIVDGVAVTVERVKSLRLNCMFLRGWRAYVTQMRSPLVLC